MSADFVTQNALPEHMVIKLWCCSCPCWTRGDPFLWRWVTFANRICSVSIANVLSWCSQLKGNRSRLLGFYWLLTYLVCWINIFFLKREVLWIDLCLNNLANKSPQRVCIIINAKIICLLLNRPFFFMKEHFINVNLKNGYKQETTISCNFQWSNLRFLQFIKSNIGDL